LVNAPRRISVAAGGDSGIGMSGLSRDEAIETRRKRLLYQSGHRGTKESDLLLGAFAAAHLGSFTPAQLDAYEAMLSENDGDLFDWATGRAAPPPEKLSDVLQLLLRFRYRGAQ
jgi:antitoxin CptB